MTGEPQRDQPNHLTLFANITGNFSGVYLTMLSIIQGVFFIRPQEEGYVRDPFLLALMRRRTVPFLVETLGGFLLLAIAAAITRAAHVTAADSLERNILLHGNPSRRVNRPAQGEFGEMKVVHLDGLFTYGPDGASDRLIEETCLRTSRDREA
jgi:hypothetical protein